MTERVHDTQFPRAITRKLADEGLAPDFSPAVTMVARCAGCHLQQGQKVTAIAVAECLGVDRTLAYHHLRKLEDNRLLEELPRQPEDGIGQKARNSYTATKLAATAFSEMPHLSGCKLDYEATNGGVDNTASESGSSL